MDWSRAFFVVFVDVGVVLLFLEDCWTGLDDWFLRIFGPLSSICVLRFGLLSSTFCWLLSFVAGLPPKWPKGVALGFL